MAVLYEEAIPYLSEFRESSEGQGTALCPAHDDHQPSLSVGRGDDGRALLHCHAGCEYEDVLAALGFDTSSSRDGSGEFRTVEQYVYRDERGRLLSRVRRLANTHTGKKTFRQDRWDAASKRYLPGVQGVRRVLFMLPELLAAAMTAIIFVVEGEKDVRTLVNHGLVATCNAGGAGKWRPDFAAYLKDRHLAVLPDNDLPGRKHAHDVASSTVGVAASVKVVELPKLPPKGDVTDWFQLGRSAKELLELVRQAPEFEPVGGETGDFGDHGPRWEPLVPLSDQKLSPFPLKVLPTWLRKFVVETARSKQVPAEAVAMLSLASIASVTQGRFRCRAKADFSEPVCIWVIVFLASGSRKSEIVAVLKAPVRLWEAEQRGVWAERVEQRKTERSVLEIRINKFTSKAAGEDDEVERSLLMDEVKKLRLKLAELPEISYPALLLADATPEGYCRFLERHDGIGAILEAEPGLLQTLVGVRYNKSGPNLDAVLQGHTGESVVIHRATRDPIHIAEPYLTMGIGAQPGAQEWLGKVAELRERGFLPRIFFVQGKDIVGSRDTNPAPINQAIVNEYDKVIRAFLATRWQAPREIIFGPDAKKAWTEFSAVLEARLSRRGDLTTIRDWASKLTGGLLRLSALVHLAEHGPDAPTEVSGKTVAAAVEIAEFLIENAKVCFRAIGIDPIIKRAERIVGWIEDHGKRQFERRDVQQSLKNSGLFKRTKFIDGALDELVEHNYLRRDWSTKRAVYHVNPEVFAKDPHSPHSVTEKPETGDHGDCSPSMEASPEPTETPEPQEAQAPEETQEAQPEPTETAEEVAAEAEPELTAADRQRIKDRLRQELDEHEHKVAEMKAQQKAEARKRRRQAKGGA